MANCIVIGGGLSGISAAIHLSRLGHKVELIEASPKLGGRTYSFLDKKTNTEIDNGQHALMGLYTNTFELLDIIGSKDYLKFQTSLDIEFLRKKNVIKLSAPNIFYPLNLFIALMNFGAFSLKEKFYALKFLFKVLLTKSLSFSKSDALTWLTLNSQSKNSMSSLWEIICISSLNTSLEKASAQTFHSVLKKIFFSGSHSAKMVLTNSPLSKIFIEPAITYFNKNKISLTISETVKELAIKNNIIKEIITENRVITNFDAVVLAVPQYSIERIISSTKIIDEQYYEMETSPILTIHIWEKKKSFKKSFVGLIDSKIHWVFNNNSHLSIVISAADEFINKSQVEIMEIVSTELNRANPSFSIENISNYKVIKEKRATFKCTSENEVLRESLKSNINNLVFAGDWTNTHLPGTIEGAVLSGKLAAIEINSQKKYF